MSKSKRPRVARFYGNGNVWVGPIRGWRMRCSRCQLTSKAVKSHKAGSGLSPEMILKKFETLGWHIGKEEDHDLCPDCQRKPEKPQSNIGFAKQVLSSMVAPIINTANGHRLPFAELIAAARNLAPEQARELILVLRERLPKTIRKPKPEPEPEPLPQDEEDYKNWLNEHEQS